jgi:hypothetical protein
MKKIAARLVVVPIFVSVTLCAKAAEDAASQGQWVGKVSATFNHGQVDGFLQTPAGGQTGTSSYRRPTLSELNIDDAAFYDVLGSVQWQRLNLYAGYQTITLDGGATLSESLISRGVTFPAATHVHSETELNWARIGAGWKFECLSDRLELIPKAELAVLDFNYKLAGGGQAVDRSYAKVAYRLGLDSRYRVNRVVSVSLNAGGSLPLSNTPQIMAITGGVELDLAGANQRVRPQLFLGGGAQRIEYEDNQAFPNHFRVDIAPFITVGLGVSF